MDETMLGGKIPGKRGWGAQGKQMVFGIYKRNGKVLTFPNSSRAGDTLIPLITHYTTTGSLITLMTGLPMLSSLSEVTRWWLPKRKGNQKAETILMALRDSGHMPNIGYTSIVVYPNNTSTFI